VEIIRGNLATARAEYATLSAIPTPAGLRTEKQRADDAFAGWTTQYESAEKIVEMKVRNGMTLAQFQELDLGSSGGSPTDLGADPRLNSAMSALAGQNCTVTSTS
jgi:hypothetical protein